MSEEHKSLNQIIEFRKEKLSKLREAGVDPYPQKYEPTHFSSDILNDFKKPRKTECEHRWKNYVHTKNG